MKMQIDSSSVDRATIVMTRTFDAPRELVWEALTNPKHVQKWYGGHYFSNPHCEMDVREGGIWRHEMRTPQGHDFKLEFVYVEVKKPERLVWKHVDHDTRKDGPPKSIMTVTLEDLGAKTKWTLVAEFDSIAQRDEVARTGFASIISEGAEKLNDIVKGLLATVATESRSLS